MESVWLSTTGSAVPRSGFLAFLLLSLLLCTTFSSTEAYDALDPTGNITIKWDVISWTPDGYMAVVTMYNFQQYRHIEAPGWILGWTWAKKEVIWNVMGGQTTEQGDCSRFKGNIPHCCKKDPTVVDLLPGSPYNQQIANCCTGGVLTSWAQDPEHAISSFQLSVGSAGTTNKTVKLPRNFTLKAPGPGYTCGPAKIVKPTKFITKDKRRSTQALMTWNVTCTYSQFLAQKTPTCCVSLSSFYNSTIVNCPTCTCGCQNKTEPSSCVDPNSPHLASVVSPPGKSINTPLVRCTNHMCPIRVHWHVKLQYKLMRFTRAGETTTYAGVMREAFGPVGAVAAQIAVVVTNMGCLIMYLIIAADVFSGNKREGEVHFGVLQQWFGVHWWNSREFALLVILFLILLPLVLYRRVESLKFSSAISTFLAVAFVTTCTVLAVIAIIEGRTESPKLIPRLDEQTSFFDLFTAVPVIVTAYTFHFNVHPIGFELANASDMTTAVRLALLLCAAIYFSIGLFGYLLFGDSTQSDILVNFDQNTGSAIGSLLNVLVRLSYGFHVILTFPLLNFSLRTNIDEFFFSKKPLLATDTKRFVSLTLVLLVLSYIAAVAVPDIWYIFQFVGSTSTVCLSFVFPGAIVLRDSNGIATRRDKIIALVMIILAAITSVIAISTNIYKAFQ